MESKKALGPIAFASVLALVGSVSMTDTADAAVYVKFDGIKGESKSAGYKDAIDILSWSWGASQQYDRKGPARRPTLCLEALSFDKTMDLATAALIQRLSTGDSLSGAMLISTLQTADGGEIPVLELVFSPDTRISSYAVSQDGDNRATETLTITFSEVEGTYYPVHDAGRAREPQTFFAGPGYCS